MALLESKRIERTLLAASLLFSVTAPSAAPGAVVFHIGDDSRPVAAVDQLGQMPEGLRAILAMYALQVGGGCEGHDAQGLKCELTIALGLGPQCSQRHVDLVRAWFGSRLPAMQGRYSSPDGVLHVEDLMSICYQSPYTATNQTLWESIRVRTEGDIVSVDAISHWTLSADGPFGTNEFSSTYRFEDGRVTVLSHSRAK